MKEKDLKKSFKEQQLIYYAEKEDQSIGPVVVSSYMAENHLDDFYRIWDKTEKELSEQLQKGRISPIARFKTLAEFTTKELASRTGIPLRRVKKHLLMKHFLKARVAELQEYAEVFNVPVANLFQIIQTKEDASWNMGYNRTVAEALPLNISQEKTANPLVVITNPIKNES